MSILNYYDPEINTSGGGSEGTLGPSLVRAPVGTIVVWSGDMDNIPDGWALCDGQDGRPDLRDKFVLGAGGTYNPGAAGTVGNGGDLAYSAQCYIIKVIADSTDGLTGEVYSTEEIRIGTWIDGKPLYRRVLVCTTPSGTGGWYSVHDRIPGAEPKFMIGYIASGNEYIEPLPSSGGTGPNKFCYVASDTSISNVPPGLSVYVSGSFYTGKPCFFSIEYTKTSDKATIKIPSILDIPALLPADTEVLDNELNPEEV